MEYWKLSIRKLSELIEKLEHELKDDENKLWKAVKDKNLQLESIYQERCNIKEDILRNLRTIDQLWANIAGKNIVITKDA